MNYSETIIKLVCSRRLNRVSNRGQDWMKYIPTMNYPPITSFLLLERCRAMVNNCKSERPVVVGQLCRHDVAMRNTRPVANYTYIVL